MSSYDAKGVPFQTHLRISTVNGQGSFQRRVGHFLKSLSGRASTTTGTGTQANGKTTGGECSCLCSQEYRLMLADMNGHARVTDAGADIQSDRRPGTVHRAVLYSMHEEASWASCAGSGLPANPVLFRRSQPHTRHPRTADLFLYPQYLDSGPRWMQYR